MKDKDIKLQEIKKHNPSLYADVVDGKVELQDAYNETMGEINKTSEYKGRGTKGRNKIGLSKGQIIWLITLSKWTWIKSILIH